MAIEQEPYPSGVDWQQKISSALGVRLGQLNYTLDEAVAKLEYIRQLADKAASTGWRDTPTQSTAYAEGMNVAGEQILKEFER